MDADELRERLKARRGSDVPDAAWHLAQERGLVDDALLHGEAGEHDLETDLQEILEELASGHRPRDSVDLERLRLALFARLLGRAEETAGDALVLEEWGEEPVQATVRGRGTIVVEAGYWVTSESVARAFEEARRRALGRRFRPVGERTLLLAEFALDQRPGQSYRERLAAWNDLHPQYAYAHRLQFQTALKEAVRRAFVLPVPDHPGLAAILELLAADEPSGSDRREGMATGFSGTPCGATPDVIGIALERLEAARRDLTSGAVHQEHPVEWLWAVHDELPAEAYPPGVVPATVHIRGTAAFPGGTGLVMETGGSLPVFPYGGVMVVAQDLDAENKYLDRARSGRAHGDPRSPMDYWKSTRRLFERGGLALERCFFTNVFAGLRVGARASGGPFPGRNDTGFVLWCREFLGLQVDVMRPSLIVFFGEYARAAYDLPGGVLTKLGLGGQEAVAVTLAYPNRPHLTARTRSYGGLTGLEAEVALLRDAVAAAAIPPSTQP